MSDKEKSHNVNVYIRICAQNALYVHSTTRHKLHHKRLQQLKKASLSGLNLIANIIT